MATKTSHFKVGNGDMLLIETGSARRIIVDINISSPDSPSDERPDVGEQLRDRLSRDSKGRLYVGLSADPSRPGSLPGPQKGFPPRTNVRMSKDDASGSQPMVQGSACPHSRAPGAPLLGWAHHSAHREISETSGR